MRRDSAAKGRSYLRPRRLLGSGCEWEATSGSAPRARSRGTNIAAMGRSHGQDIAAKGRSHKNQKPLQERAMRARG